MIFQTYALVLIKNIYHDLQFVHYKQNKLLNTKMKKAIVIKKYKYYL
jgi:hypothetical protein